MSTLPPPRRPDPALVAEWDGRYAGDAQRLWSGEPNGALVDEVGALPPGRALDVGCGEGADAVWLAARGWDVTALDVSRVALDRAARHAAEAGVAVTWLHAGLLDADLAPGAFDLVTAQYPALRRTGPDDRTGEDALLAAVAPGGTLLVVHHAGAGGEAARAAGFDPAGYVLPADVAAVLATGLGAGWVLEVDERRPRHVTGGAGHHHTEDQVLRARRRV